VQICKERLLAQRVANKTLSPISIRSWVRMRSFPTYTHGHGTKKISEEDQAYSYHFELAAHHNSLLDTYSVCNALKLQTSELLK
jgi:hypothetical protein